jgi:hypothetical protein
MTSLNPATLGSQNNLRCSLDAGQIQFTCSVPEGQGKDGQQAFQYARDQMQTPIEFCLEQDILTVKPRNQPSFSVPKEALIVREGHTETPSNPGAFMSKLIEETRRSEGASYFLDVRKGLEGEYSLHLVRKQDNPGS